MNKRHPFIKFIILGIIGVLWHFLYELCGNNMIMGIIAPINESAWEHLKILFFPAVIYSLIEYYLMKDKTTYITSALAVGLLSGMLIITVFFYTYTGVLGFDVSFLNIASYYIGLIVFLYFESKIYNEKKFTSNKSNTFFLIILIIFALLFAVFTFYQPNLGIFISP